MESIIRVGVVRKQAAQYPLLRNIPQMILGTPNVIEGICPQSRGYGLFGWDPECYVLIALRLSNPFNPTQQESAMSGRSTGDDGNPA